MSMEKLVVEGGRPLSGEICVSGAKNAVLPLMFASLLSDEELRLSNAPHLRDIETTVALLRKMGGEVEVRGKELRLGCARVSSLRADPELVKNMRASILMLGPTLARFGEAEVALPGGCAIGSRPIDQHLKGLRALGARIDDNGERVVAKSPRLKGARFRFDVKTVGGTENVLMAACLAEGETILENAAREPEVEDLARCLIEMGAEIYGAGTDKIRIVGVDRLKAATHCVAPDRIETGTYLCAVSMVGGRAMLRNAAPRDMSAILDKVAQSGALIECGDDWILVESSGRPRPVSATTEPYPGFPTDMQAQLMAMDCVADGESRIEETIFENRMMHVAQLRKLGADIELLDGKSKALVRGVDRLKGAEVVATDLRAAASLLLAALSADGQTSIDRIYHLDRGYDDIAGKLNSIGAKIKRVQA